ncbi:MAG TPA: hypothetical protein VJO54_16165 [Burkholderiales bacterium]|nr:hypothetical protein [Burkholderiales bacterium]
MPDPFAPVEIGSKEARQPHVMAPMSRYRADAAEAALDDLRRGALNGAAVPCPGAGV